MATMSIEQALAVGIEHHDAGRLRQAESIYRQILSHAPEHAEALRMLGLLAFQVGRAADALPLIERAIRARPAAADYYANLGVILASLNRLDDAVHALRQSLVLNPTDPETSVNLANVLVQKQRHDEAIDLYQRAIARRRELPAAHYNLGRAFQEKGDLNAAIGAYLTAVSLDPNNADAYNNLGNVLKDKGRASEAIDAYRRAIAIKSQFPEAYYNLGKALHDTGKTDQEIAAYRQALALRPEYPEAFNNLGNVLESHGQADEAIDAYRRAVASRANFPEAYNNLGNVLLETGRIDEAIAAYRQALSQRGDYAEAFNNLGNALKSSGRLDEALESYRRAVALSGDSRIAGNLLYGLHFHPDSTPRSLFDEHVQWADRFARPVARERAELSNGRRAERRLRIGYVSPDFREHPVGRFMLPLLSHHDHAEFEVYCYTDITVPDALTDRLKPLADVWRPTVGLSDEKFAELVRADGIDILVDLTMHLKGSRLLGFARRAAPVQITYLAYCSTTGLEQMDYRFSDPHLDPPGIDESVYTEKTVRLPSTYWCYLAPEGGPDVGSPPVQAAGRITFGCLNAYAKVTGRMLEVWCGLLKEVPDSRLVLHAHEGSHRQRAYDLFEREGVAPDRVEFVGFHRLGAYLEQYNRIDIALDPHPYGGGTTTCDALWMGVPVVSLEGATAVSRAAKSILTNVGLAELVAKSADHYVEIAARLARDGSRLAELRGSLRQRLKDSPLMDAPRFAREVEEVYRRLSQS
jgi:predicted O-linked N-acetylglucosamine transferase (SPINDLY family)